MGPRVQCSLLSPPRHVHTLGGPAAHTRTPPPPPGGVSPAVRGPSRALRQPLAHVLRHRMSEAAALRGPGLTWPSRAQPRGRASSYLGAGPVPVLQALHQGPGRPRTARQGCRRLAARTGQSRCPRRLGKRHQSRAVLPGSSQLNPKPAAPPGEQRASGRPEGWAAAPASPSPWLSVCDRSVDAQSWATGHVLISQDQAVLLGRQGRQGQRDSRSKAQWNHPTAPH